MGMILQDWSVGNTTAPELLSKVRQGGWKRNMGLIVIVGVIVIIDWMRNIGLIIIIRNMRLIIAIA